MKDKLIVSGAVLALISQSSAVTLQKKERDEENMFADVYGPNGENYKNDNASYDMSRIGIDVLEKGKGKKCAVGDWATVTWKGYLKDGRLVTDSALEGDSRPKTFALGNKDVFECWELALPQLKMGARAKLSCPGYLVWGGAHTWAPVGGEPIPLHSDIDFEINVEECNRNPKMPEEEEQPVTTTMQPDRCMYLHLEESDSTAYDLVMSTEAEDFSDWWPAKYVMLEQKVVDDPAQQWYYNEAAGTLHNAANPKYFLENDLGWVMVAKQDGKGDGKKKVKKGGKGKKDEEEDDEDETLVQLRGEDDKKDDGEEKKDDKKGGKGKKPKKPADDFPRGKRRWYYDPKTSSIQTTVMGIKAEVTIFGQPKNWAEVELSPLAKQEGKNSSKFRIEYCYDGTNY